MLFLEEMANDIDVDLCCGGNALDGMMTPGTGNENEDVGDDDTDRRHKNIGSIDMLNFFEGILTLGTRIRGMTAGD